MERELGGEKGPWIYITLISILSYNDPLLLSCVEKLPTSQRSVSPSSSLMLEISGLTEVNAVAETVVEPWNPKAWGSEPDLTPS